MSTARSGHSAAAATCSSTAIWLVGQPLSSIEQPSQLPAIGVVLRRLFFEMKSNKVTLPTACSTVVDEVVTFWVKANIPTSAKPNVVAKLKSIHHDYISVCVSSAAWFHKKQCCFICSKRDSSARFIHFDKSVLTLHSNLAKIYISCTA